MTRTDFSTAQAAAWVGISEASFHAWAKRRGLSPSRKVRLGRATVNLWDADAVCDAQRVIPDYSRERQR